MVIVKKIYKILWSLDSESGVCEDSDFIYVFKKYKNFYRIFSPPDDFILDLIDNKYRSSNAETPKTVYLLKIWEVDLIKKEQLL